MGNQGRRYSLPRGLPRVSLFRALFEEFVNRFDPNPIALCIHMIAIFYEDILKYDSVFHRIIIDGDSSIGEISREVAPDSKLIVASFTEWVLGKWSSSQNT